MKRHPRTALFTEGDAMGVFGSHVAEQELLYNRIFYVIIVTEGAGDIFRKRDASA